jgi:ADP-ribose pyrophosphatase YjhB (NUDIX family)
MPQENGEREVSVSASSLSMQKLRIDPTKRLRWLQKLIEQKIVTSAWVGVILYDEEDSAILMVREKDKPAWSISGGGLELFDSSLKKAGARELFQETRHLIHPDSLYLVDVFFTKDTRVIDGKIHAKIFFGCCRKDVVAVSDRPTADDILGVKYFPAVVKDEMFFLMDEDGIPIINVHQEALRSFARTFEQRQAMRY